MIISEQFLQDNGFVKKQGDEVYYENVLTSSEPSTTIYVYANAISMQIGGNGPERPLNITNENQLSNFIESLNSVL